MKEVKKQFKEKYKTLLEQEEAKDIKDRPFLLFVHKLCFMLVLAWAILIIHNAMLVGFVYEAYMNPIQALGIVFFAFVLKRVP